MLNNKTLINPKYRNQTILRYNNQFNKNLEEYFRKDYLIYLKLESRDKFRKSLIDNLGIFLNENLIKEFTEKINVYYSYNKEDLRKSDEKKFNKLISEIERINYYFLQVCSKLDKTIKVYKDELKEFKKNSKNVNLKKVIFPEFYKIHKKKDLFKIMKEYYIRSKYGKQVIKKEDLKEITDFEVWINCNMREALEYYKNKKRYKNLSKNKDFGLDDNDPLLQDMLNFLGSKGSNQGGKNNGKQ